MTTDESTTPPIDDTEPYPDDWTHPRLYDVGPAADGHPIHYAVDPGVEMPEIITPLDRINPLTGRGPGVRELGTITGRLTPPKDPPLQRIPPVNAVRVRNAPVDAAELLDEAARLITDALRVDNATAREMRQWELDGAAWLRRFRRDIAR